MKAMTKYFLAPTFAGLSLLAWAAIRGPFYVGAAASKWAQQTFQDDVRSEYDGAEAVFSALVQNAILAPSDRIAAIKSDYLRVIYYDGVIADFKIVSFDKYYNLKFVKKQPYAEAPAPTPARVKKASVGNCGAGASQYAERTTYDTGYWGDSQTSRPNPNGGLPIIVATATWISTGEVTITKFETCK